jgi:hypothetical protein
MTIEQRLARLERDNRLLKMVVFACVAILGCVGFIAADKPDGEAAEKVAAKKFVLVDNSGKPRGAWTADGLIAPSVLADRVDTPLLQMRANKTDEPAALLKLGDNKRAHLKFIDPSSPKFNGSPSVATTVSVAGIVHIDGNDLQQWPSTKPANP